MLQWNWRLLSEDLCVCCFARAGCACDQDCGQLSWSLAVFCHNEAGCFLEFRNGAVVTGHDGNEVQRRDGCRWRVGGLLKSLLPCERQRPGARRTCPIRQGKSSECPNREQPQYTFPSSSNQLGNASNDTIQSILIECPLQLSPSAKHSQSAVGLMSFHLPGHACPT